MPTHYSCFQGQILRIVFYCPVCTVVKASVVSISHWLMPVKFGKECALRGPVQTRWLGRRKASGALLAQEAEEGKLISHYGRLFLDPKCSHKLSFEVCFSIWIATISQHGGPHQGPPSVLISLLQWTVPLQRISNHSPGSTWLLTSYWWQPKRPYGSCSPMAELTSMTALTTFLMAVLIHNMLCCLSLWDHLPLCAVMYAVICLAAFTNEFWV